MNHPSKEIISTKGQELKGRKIALCITGSVSASECPKIARELMRYGAEVIAIFSQKAQEIIHPNLMEWATGNPPITKLTGKIEHVALAGLHKNKVDLVLVSPATANTISKISCGICDTAVTSIVLTALGSKIPVILVPAMHEPLFANPLVRENIKQLVSKDVDFVSPKIEEGKAKIASVDDIVEAVIRRLSNKDMVGIRILVTAGPTLEYIDPIRVITNKSSGKMGVAIAKEAFRRGAEVTLIYGRGTVSPPQCIKVINIETTEELYNSVLYELKVQEYDVLISASAVADFAPTIKYDRKLMSKVESNITLKPLPKLIDKARELHPKIFLVAFKAEYGLPEEELVDKAYELLKASKANLVIANDVSKKGVGFGTDTNEVFIININHDIVHVPLLPKDIIAKKILDMILKERKKFN